MTTSKVRRQLLPRAFAFLVLALATSCVSPPPARMPASTPLTFLRAEGMAIVNEQGTPVHLRGCNAGGWLLIEPWMIGLDENLPLQSEKELWDLLTDRFGEAASRELMKTYRDNFFTEDDVRRIAESGMNCIRLPIWWRVASDPAYEGLDYIDRFVEWCERHGLYAILDLHGAPGTQSDKAVIMGEPADSGLWADPKFKKQSVDWWRTIAQRYKDRPAVAGYDLLNEAFTAPFDDMVRLYDEMYKAIRETGSRQIIIMEDGLIGFHRLPHPSGMGWENVAYSFHYYPQNGEEAFAAPGRILPTFNRSALSYGVPCYVGEFNTILHDRGGVETFLRYREVFDYYGWPWTFWNWKRIEYSRDVLWGITGYYDSAPSFDPYKDSEEALHSAFEAMNSRHSQENSLLRAAVMASPRWAPEQAGPEEILMTLRTAVLTPGEKGELRMEWGPAWPNAGYWSNSDSVTWKIAVETEGVYDLVIHAANTSGKNRVGVWVDGVRRLASPIRNTLGWHQYEDQSLGRLKLSAGAHTITLDQADQEDSFINLRQARLRAAFEEQPHPPLENQMRFNALNMTIRSNSPVRVEWVNNPPNIGFWAPGEQIAWPVELARGGAYRATITYATPDADTTMALLVNGQPLHERKLAPTKGWHIFKSVDLGEVQLDPGRQVLVLAWSADHAGSTGNFRELRLERITEP